MSYIAIRETPAYNVVPEYFKFGFESQLLTSYIRRIEDEQHIRLGLPIIDDDLIFNDAISQEVWAAAYLDYRQYPGYYLNFTKNKSRLEAFEMSVGICDILEEKRNPLFDDLMYEDVALYLNHHHISFVDLGFLDHEHRNLPIRQVW
ncbi:hypothetical protein [Priestia megaterium]|uniref:hypothetical protein n=1 Tax=Priestia megaterium TaxID=1404 RepID=UPI000BFE1B46|nr:hypothetical protein [Priestia megaterium]PGQ88237.1 hypothetical protein COA18_04740 [Priestia megaterium]